MQTEWEIKLSVGADYNFPNLEDLCQIEDIGVEQLHTAYYDTNSMALAVSGWGLRYRSGGGPAWEKWTAKGPSTFEGDAAVRQEYELNAPDGEIPAELLAVLPTGISADDLHPVAVLALERHILLARRGPESCEITDDRVMITNPAGVRAGDFREIEIEAKSEFHGLAQEIAARLKKSGAVPSPDVSKYQRAQSALGLNPH